MTFEDPLSRLIAQRCGDNFKHLPESPPTEERTTFPLDFEDGLDIPLNMDVTDMSDLLGTSDISDFSELLGLQPEDLLWDGGSATTAASKRKSCHDTCPNRAVRPRTESDGVTDDLTALRNIMTRSPCHSSSEEIRQDSAISQSCALELAPKEYQAVDRGQSASPCSDMSDQSFVGQSVEFHFQKIQDHINLAIDALRQSQYEHKKGIVTWAHELKNKAFSEVRPFLLICTLYLTTCTSIVLHSPLWFKTLAKAEKICRPPSYLSYEQPTLDVCLSHLPEMSAFQGMSN